MENGELLTKEDLKQTSEIEKGEYRLKYESRNDEEKDSELVTKIRNIVEEKGTYIFGNVYNDTIVSADISGELMVGLRDSYLDEYNESAGSSRKIATYVIDSAKEEILLEEGPLTYRDGRSSSMDDWSIAYDDAKILENNGEELVVARKSGKRLRIEKFDIDERRFAELVESYDLEEENKEQRKQESVDEAIDELDHSGISDIIESFYSWSTFLRKAEVSDNLVLAGATAYHGYLTNEDLYLIVKGKGVLKLGEEKLEIHNEPSDKNDYNVLSLEDVAVTYAEDKMLISGVIHKYTDVYMGRNITLQDKEFSYEVDIDVDPVGRFKRDLQEVEEGELEGRLNHANLNPIPMSMYGFRDDYGTATYPYSIEEVVDYEKGEAYVVMMNVIDAERYSKSSGYGRILVEPQFKVSAYKVSNLGTGKPEVKELGSETTDSNDRKKYALNVEFNPDTHQGLLAYKPELTVKDGFLEAVYKVAGEEVKEKRFKFVS